jgi:hypothetical protein
MLLNASKQKRKPSIISQEEFDTLVDWTCDYIDNYLSKGHRSFTTKDLFGLTHWDWSSKHLPIQTLYYKWREKIELDSDKSIRESVISDRAFQNAGQAVGYIIKAACEKMPQKFKTKQEFRTTRYIVV